MCTMPTVKSIEKVLITCGCLSSRGVSKIMILEAIYNLSQLKDSRRIIKVNKHNARQTFQDVYSLLWTTLRLLKEMEILVEVTYLITSRNKSSLIVDYLVPFPFFY